MKGETKVTISMKTEIVAQNKFDSKDGDYAEEVPLKVEEFLLVEDVTYVKMEEPCLLAFWQQSEDVMEKTVNHSEDESLHTIANEWDMRWKDYGDYRKGKLLQSSLHHKTEEKETNPCYTWQITKWLISEKPFDSGQSGACSSPTSVISKHLECSKDAKSAWQREVNDPLELTDKIISDVICHHCPAKFHEKDDLLRHINEIHREDDVGYFQCSRCSASFDSKIDIVNHLQDINNLCTVCSVYFCSASDLQAHYEEHGRTNKYTCHYCNCTFNYELQHREHMLYHRESKEYANPLCRNSHPRKCKKSRTEAHCVGKPYECVLCPKTYSHKHSFEMHIRKHIRGKMHRCNLCSSIFYSKHSFLDHMKIMHCVRVSS